MSRSQSSITTSDADDDRLIGNALIWREGGRSCLLVSRGGVLLKEEARFSLKGPPLPSSAATTGTETAASLALVARGASSGRAVDDSSFLVAEPRYGLRDVGRSSLRVDSMSWWQM